MLDSTTQELSYAYQKEERQVCVFVNENEAWAPAGRRVIPVV